MYVLYRVQRGSWINVEVKERRGKEREGRGKGEGEGYWGYLSSLSLSLPQSLLRFDVWINWPKISYGTCNFYRREGSGDRIELNRRTDPVQYTCPIIHVRSEESDPRSDPRSMIWRIALPAVSGQRSATHHHWTDASCSRGTSCHYVYAFLSFLLCCPSSRV